MELEKLSKYVSSLQVSWKENLSSSASCEQTKAILSSVFNKQRKERQKYHRGSVLPAFVDSKNPLKKLPHI